MSAFCGPLYLKERVCVCVCVCVCENLSTDYESGLNG